jgi:hypothetical protein
VYKQIYFLHFYLSLFLHSVVSLFVFFIFSLLLACLSLDAGGIVLAGSLVNVALLLLHFGRHLLRVGHLMVGLQNNNS